jgi:hypothetical protein
LDLYYRRAYDPFTGTWGQADPYRGLLGEPRSLNRFGFVESNPASAWDVGGFWLDGPPRRRSSPAPRVTHSADSTERWTSGGYYGGGSVPSSSQNTQNTQNWPMTSSTTQTNGDHQRNVIAALNYVAAVNADNAARKQAEWAAVGGLVAAQKASEWAAVGGLIAAQKASEWAAVGALVAAKKQAEWAAVGGLVAAKQAQDWAGAAAAKALSARPKGRATKRHLAGCRIGPVRIGFLTASLATDVLALRRAECTATISGSRPGSSVLAVAWRPLVVR